MGAVLETGERGAALHALTDAELRLGAVSRRRHRSLALLALTGGLLLHAPLRPSETFDQCVKRRTAAGDSEAVAKAACLTGNTPNSTTPGGGGTISASSSDEGASTAMVALIGIAGVALGAVGATVLRRKPAASAQPAAQPAAGASPVLQMPPPGASAPAPANDRSPALITALIDLADRVNSQALRAEILAALGRAGVQQIEPAQGEPFDVSRMRGVGNAPAPDPSWVGRVASTDRAGFHDGVSVLRLPEVIVFTAGA
jgi:hypothetical protein